MNIFLGRFRARYNTFILVKIIAASGEKSWYTTDKNQSVINTFFAWWFQF